MHVAKTKALISCTVTEQLLCAFVSHIMQQKSGFLMMWLISSIRLHKLDEPDGTYLIGN